MNPRSEVQVAAASEEDACDKSTTESTADMCVEEGAAEEETDWDGVDVEVGQGKEEDDDGDDDEEVVQGEDHGVNVPERASLAQEEAVEEVEEQQEEETRPNENPPGAVASASGSSMAKDDRISLMAATHAMRLSLGLDGAGPGAIRASPRSVEVVEGRRESLSCPIVPEAPRAATESTDTGVSTTDDDDDEEQPRQIVAVLVSDMEFAEATPVHEEDHVLSAENALLQKFRKTHVVIQWRYVRRWLLCIGGFFLMLLATIIILLPLFLIAENQNDKDPKKPTIHYTEFDPNRTCLTLVRPPFLDTLDPNVLKEISNPCTTQALANEWMWDDIARNNYSEARQIQRFTLVSAYYAFGAPFIHPKPSDNWLQHNVSECLWGYPLRDHNVCDDNNVTQILNISNTGMTGTIPDEMLLYLAGKINDLSHNQFQGNFPFVGEGMYQAEELDISYNNFTGGFTGEMSYEREMAIRVIKVQHNSMETGLPAMIIGAMPNLTYADLSNNRFKGLIPQRVFKFLGKLEVLIMANNSFEGVLDENYLELHELRILDYSGNAGMYGKLPALDQLSNLEYIDFRRTSIQGPIPQGLCDKAKEGKLQIWLDDCGSDGWSDCCLG